MKYLYFLGFLTGIFVYSCKPAQEISSSNSEKPYPIEINIPETVTQGESLNIDIISKSELTILLHDPMLLQIEKFNDQAWTKIRIAQCPCGANCEPPPRIKKLSVNETWKLKWNLIESWCEKESEKDIPVTITNPAGSGKYRIVIYYGFNENERIKFIKEFQIIN